MIMEMLHISNNLSSGFVLGLWSLSIKALSDAEDSVIALIGLKRTRATLKEAQESAQDKRLYYME